MLALLQTLKSLQKNWNTFTEHLYNYKHEQQRQICLLAQINP